MWPKYTIEYKTNLFNLYLRNHQKDKDFTWVTKDEIKPNTLYNREKDALRSLKKILEKRYSFIMGQINPIQDSSYYMIKVNKDGSIEELYKITSLK